MKVGLLPPVRSTHARAVGDIGATGVGAAVGRVQGPGLGVDRAALVVEGDLDTGGTGTGGLLDDARGCVDEGVGSGAAVEDVTVGGELVGSLVAEDGVVVHLQRAGTLLHDGAGVAQCAAEVVGAAAACSSCWQHRPTAPDALVSVMVPAFVSVLPTRSTLPLEDHCKADKFSVPPPLPAFNAPVSVAAPAPPASSLPPVRPWSR